jgi:hypothetical protein
LPVLLIPIAALAIWPIYSVISRSTPYRRHIRLVLLVIFLFQLLVTVLVGSTRFGHDMGRFDDAMMGLVVIGCLSLLCSLLVLAAGEVMLFFDRRGRGARGV